MKLIKGTDFTHLLNQKQKITTESEKGSPSQINFFLFVNASTTSMSILCITIRDTLLGNIFIRSKFLFSMTKLMPQEVEVWYLIPALRREIAIFLMKDYEYSQKHVAESLGMTESAVSQYVSGKRGHGIKFEKGDLEVIKKSADKIAKNKKDGLEVLYKLSKKLMGNQSVCELHKKQDSSIPKNCDVCRK